ncbi:MAG: 4'-phosphopantetheinyl transferase superfamily protein [Bdellovibrionota bacterium]
MFKSPFPKGVAFEIVTKDSPFELSLHPEEEKLLSDQALPRRKEQLVLGRTAARRALQQLGVKHPPAILRGAGRNPLFPEGYLGSISHSAGIGIAAVAPTKTTIAIGIDLENFIEQRPERVAQKICTASELDWVCKRDTPMRTAMIFSAKECIYKCFYPCYQKYFGFEAVTLTWTEDHFNASLEIDISADFPKGYKFQVAAQVKDDFVLTSCIVFR